MKESTKLLEELYPERQDFERALKFSRAGTKSHVLLEPLPPALNSKVEGWKKSINRYKPARERHGWRATDFQILFGIALQIKKYKEQENVQKMP